MTDKEMNKAAQDIFELYKSGLEKEKLWGKGNWSRPISVWYRVWCDGFCLLTPAEMNEIERKFEELKNDKER